MNAPLPLAGRADSILETEARESLTYKLISGDRVQGLDICDLADCELDSEKGYQAALGYVCSILRADYSEVAAKVDEFKSWLVNRHLDDPKGQFAIEEEMADMELRAGWEES